MPLPYRPDVRAAGGRVGGSSAHQNTLTRCVGRRYTSRLGRDIRCVGAAPRSIDIFVDAPCAASIVPKARDGVF